MTTASEKSRGRPISPAQGDKTARRKFGRPFPKGISGNPGGRPPKSLMQRELEKLSNDPKFVREWIEATKKRMKQPGVAGFLQSRETLDRVDGPVTQQTAMEVSGKLTLESVLEAKKRAGRLSVSESPIIDPQRVGLPVH